MRHQRKRSRRAPTPLLLCLLYAFVAVACQAGAAAPELLASGHRFRPTSRPVISSPTAYDWDRDGTLEIAVGAWDGYFYRIDANLNDLPGWPKHSPKGYFSSPALADLNDDGTPEIVVGSDAGKLFGWQADGQSAAGFPVDLGYPLWASPTVMSGGRLAIGGNEQMWLLDSGGRPSPGWPQAMQGWADATAASCPGLLAVTTLTPGDPSRGWLYAWNEAGGLLDGYPWELPLDSDSSPALADFDRDGQEWIVFGDDAGWLHVVHAASTGIERPGFPVRSQGHSSGPTPTPHPPGGNVHSIEASPAVADLNGDGRIEIAVGSWDGRMYLWDDRGQSLPGWPVTVADQIISSAALADLDGDDLLDILVGSKDGFLYGWTAEGRTLPGFPKDLGAAVFSSPWVGDLDGDARADIVVGANNGIHLLSNVGAMGRRAWPTFHGNAQRTGAASCP